MVPYTAGMKFSIVFTVSWYVFGSFRFPDKVRVSVMVRVSIRSSWVVNFALFRCYRSPHLVKDFDILGSSNNPSAKVEKIVL